MAEINQSTYCKSIGSSYNIHSICIVKALDKTALYSNTIGSIVDIFFTIIGIYFRNIDSSD